MAGRWRFRPTSTRDACMHVVEPPALCMTLMFWMHILCFCHIFTLQNYFGTCSYNKTTWHPSNIIVLGPFEIPCTGVAEKRYSERLVVRSNFSMRTACGPGELFSMREALYAKTYEVKQGKIADACADYSRRRSQPCGAVHLSPSAHEAAVRLMLHATCISSLLGAA